jgi:hypothetical protein
MRHKVFGTQFEYEKVVRVFLSNSVVWHAAEAPLMKNPKGHVCMSRSIKVVMARDLAKILDVVQIRFDRIAPAADVEDSLYGWADNAVVFRPHKTKDDRDELYRLEDLEQGGNQ